MRIGMIPLLCTFANGENKGKRSFFLRLNDNGGVVDSVHSYSGGAFWRPVVHGLNQLEGKEVSLRVKKLTRSNFLASLSPITYQNTFGARWAPQKMTISDFELNGNTITMKMSAHPSNDMHPSFLVKGTVDKTFSNSNGGPRLGFKLNGLLGGSKRIAIYLSSNYLSSKSSGMGIEDGREFRRLKMVYSDGVRLVLVYDKFRDFNSSTLYVGDPSSLYSFEEESIPLMRIGGCPTLRWFTIKIVRNLEQRMLAKGSSYDHGRLGVEIAYSILRRELDTSDFVIPEPSKGGKDLYSSNGRISVQARLIFDFRQFRPLGLQEVISSQLKTLLSKIRQDFTYNPWMTKGFVVLSYFDQNRNVQAILAASGPR